MRIGLGLGLGFGGALAPFVPTNVAGCVLWLRADKGVTIGTGVSAWADQSGSGDTNKNVTQSTGAQQPTRNASDAAFNNQATLSFASAASQLLVSGTWATPLPKPSTIFLVGSETAGGVYWSDGLVVNEQVTSVSAGGAPSIYAGAGPITAVATIGTSPAVIAALFNGASSKIWVNAKTPSVTGDAGSTTRTGMHIGSAGNGAGCMNGKIAEVLVYNSALGTSDFAAVMNYLGTRYGIAIGA